MNVLLLNTGQDTAGGSIRTKQAFARLAPDWNVRAINAEGHGGQYLAYPVDMLFANHSEAKRWYDWADVVHMGNTLHGWEWFDQKQGKRAVLHHHGTIFRHEHRILSARARQIGAVELCSTLDLTLIEPNVTWAPTPYNLEWLASFRKPHEERVGRVAHAPTNRDIKSTEAVIAAVDSLRERGYSVELDLIEGASWQECLSRKGRADIFIDQVILGYGCNAIEAWGMGIPVIAGAADPKVRKAMLERWGTLPFLEATEDTIADAILAFVKSTELRAEYAAKGRAHIERWHDERKVIPFLQDIYTNAPPTRWARKPTPIPVSGAERRAVAGGTLDPAFLQWARRKTADVA